MKIRYKHTAFKAANLDLVDQANVIIAEYQADGFTLTLRQLYYQFVSLGIVPNSERSYKNLGRLISDARLAGLIDWDAIEDRGRFLRALESWEDPEDMLRSSSESHHLRRWDNQDAHVEVWIEKDALVGVAVLACQKWDVPLFSCRGYTSQTAVWEASQRLVTAGRQGKTPVIIHLGDHDPSGIDMTRDIKDRLELFCRMHRSETPVIHRIALEMDQVKQYKPPPNPTKLTDTRAWDYVNKYGSESWELDALKPQVLMALIEAAIQPWISDPDDFDAIATQEAVEKEQLWRLSEEFVDLIKIMENNYTFDEIETTIRTLEDTKEQLEQSRLDNEALAEVRDRSIAEVELLTRVNQDLEDRVEDLEDEVNKKT